MNAKEIKAALADEDLQAAVEKITAKAVKAETARVVATIKKVGLPEDKAEAKIVKGYLKEVLTSIKEAA